MQALFRSIENYQVLLYLLLAMAGLYSLRRLFKAWGEWRASYFGLEREVSLRRLAQAVAILAVVLIFTCGVFSISVFVVPGLPANVLISTPTLDPLATPISPADGAGALLLSTPAVPPTVNGSQGCLARQLEITSPRPGTEITGSVDLIGTVNLPKLGFYKYEVSLQGTDTWTTIAARDKAVMDGDLGSFNPTVLTPGDYLLRIVALDNTAQIIGICAIPIRIKG